MSQKVSANGFQWVENKTQFNEYSSKTCSEDSHEGYFLEVSNQYPDNLQNFDNDLLVLPKRMKSEKVQKR